MVGRHVGTLGALMILAGCSAKQTTPEEGEASKEISLEPKLSFTSTAPSSEPVETEASHPAKVSPIAQSKGTAQIIVRVGKDVITNTDIIERCRMIALFSHRGDDPAFQKNIRPQVKEKLIEEALYEQLASQFKLDVEDETVKAYVEDYAARSGATRTAFEAELKRNGIYDSFIHLIRSQVIWSYVLMSAAQKDLLRISEKQIDEEIDKLKTNDRKRQYSVFEIVFYAKDKVHAKEAAQKTHQELVKMSQKMPSLKAFQALAQQLSQGATASEGGYRGWVVEDELDAASKDALCHLPSGQFSSPVQVRPGEYRIFYLNNLKEPGFAPQSQAKVELCVVSIPLTLKTPPEQQAVIQRRVEALVDCSSKEELQGVAKDFGYSSKIVTKALAELPMDPDSLKINACTRPIFTGESLEVVMPLRRLTPPKSEEKIDREEVRQSLEYKRKMIQAKKVVKDFESRILIQDYENG